MVQQTKKISKLENLGILNEMFTQGLEELKQVVKYIRIFGGTRYSL